MNLPLRKTHPSTSAFPAKKITTSRPNLLNPTDLQLNEEITVQTWMNGKRGRRIKVKSDRRSC